MVEKYFRKQDSGYEIIPEIVRLTAFKKHDITKDRAPMALDAIFCRNVVIYFTKEMKESLYAKFYEALNPGGLLILGKTEMLTGPAREKFTVNNTSEKIYKK